MNYNNTKWIRNFDGLYKINRQGIITSFLRNKERGKVLRPKHLKSGYFLIALSSETRKEQKYLHILLAETFIENNEPEKIFVIHKNGIKTDNRLTNLAWATKKEMIIVKQKNANKRLNAENMFNNILSNEDVLKIATLITSGDKSNKIAKLFDISEMAMTRLKRNKKFKTLINTKHPKWKQPSKLRKNQK